MPVVLTGDVHHWIPSADRRHADETESALAVECAQIAEAHGLKLTLYLTGRAARDNAAEARELAALESVEIGGHGWDAFHPRWLYRPLARIGRSPHGPSAWQRRMISKTCKELERLSGTAPATWRNHAYLHDSDTPRLLVEAGVTSWSDRVDLAQTHPYTDASGLVVLPLNTPPDHENLFHGDRTPQALGARSALQPHEWRDRVLADVDRVHSAGGTATIMAHPLCMRVVDDWQTFTSLCEGLSRYPSLFATEAAEQWRAEHDVDVRVTP